MNPSLDTIHALQQFTKNEVLRKNDPSRRRVILKVVKDANGTKHLEAKPVTLKTRFDILFHYNDYKLKSVVDFFEKAKFNSNNNATIAQTLGVLLTKAKKHNSSYFVKEINLQRISNLIKTVLHGTISKQIPENISLDASGKPVPVGAGIENPGINACWMSPIQAVRFSTEFRNKLNEKYEELKSSAVVSDRVADSVIISLHSIFEKLDTRKTIDESTIQAFRGLLLSLPGFKEDDTTMTSQEDARAFAQKLLEIVVAEPFYYKTEISYSVGDGDVKIPVPAFTPHKELANILPIQLGLDSDGTTLQELISNNVIMEEVDREAILQSDSIKLTDKQKEVVKSFPKTQETPTLQRITIDGPPPELLSLTLVRYKADGTKIHSKVTPNELLTVAVAGSDKPVQYRLVAATVHKGSSVRGGHYYTYGRTSKGTWIRYNDASVDVKSKNESLKDITSNGYLFFYERIDAKKAKQHQSAGTINFVPF